MSNYLAIATVTATLQQLISNELSSRMPGAVVTTLRPETLNSAQPQLGVNLYLFQVTPNPGIRNQDLPTRNQGGAFSQQPQLALNLHYLLTCFGKEDRLEPERLLGIAAGVIHANPVLSRAEITEAIGSAPGGILAGSDLAFQTESVKFWADTFPLDELHKLWSVFSPLPYRLSMVYHASVVLLTADVSFRRALPVQGVDSTLRGTLDIPEITQVIPTRLFWSPSATLRIRGRNLDGTGLKAIVSGVSATPLPLSAQEVALPLPAGLQPGVQQVNLERAGLQSEPLSFILHPVLAPGIALRNGTDPRTGNPVRLLVVRPQPEAVVPPRGEVLLNSIPAGNVPSMAWSSSRLLAFRIPELRSPLPVDAVPVPSDLRAAFLSQAGIHLSDLSEWSVIRDAAGNPTTDFRIVDNPGTPYLLRTSGDSWGVFYGLDAADMPGTLAFDLPELPPGEYRVRYRVNGVESPAFAESGSSAPTVRI